MAAFSRRFTSIETRRVRKGRGSVGAWIAGGLPVLLLTTTGRRSGQPHTAPLVFHREPGGSLLLIAANGAADWDPDWLRNLAVDHSAVVEIDADRIPVKAQVLDEADRAATWSSAVDAFPGLAAAQRGTKRPIPLVRLTPAPSGR